MSGVMDAPIPPPPSRMACSREIVACRDRLVAAALESSRSHALERISAYIEEQVQVAMETSGDSGRAWVDTYA